MQFRPVCLSALLFYSALSLPMLFFFCIFLYLIPLFYCAIMRKGNLSFYDGFLWGMIVYALHWYDIALFAHAQGHGIARYAVMPFLVICSAFYAGIWFWGASLLSITTKKPILSWIGSTWLYIICMQRFSFWMLGRVQGYPFSFPLIPLAAYPQTLFTLSYLHPHILLLMLITASWGMAAAWGGYHKYRLRLAVALYLPFIFGFFVCEKSEPPIHYETIGYVSPAGLSDDLLERAGELAVCCNALIARHPHITHIVMPESTLKITLNMHPEIHEALAQNIVNDDLTVILGAHRKENGCFYNSCYYIHNRLIIRGYDKSILMPFAEYIPNYWLNFAGINRIFLHNKIIMNVNRKKGDFFYGDYSLSSEAVETIFIPAICSDYYLDWYDEPQKLEIPLLLLVNETWFAGNSLKQLMRLAAQYGAIARRQDIIYVAHREAIYCSRDGDVWPLIR